VSASPTIGVLATLDTKSAEAQAVVDELERRGAQVTMLDLSLRGVAGAPDAGDPLTEDEKGDRIRHVVGATTDAIGALIEGRALQGLLAIGGGTGSVISAEVFRQLPLGLPKVLLSTLAHTPYLSDQLENSDTIVVPSLADVEGVNAILRERIAAAAAIVTALAEPGPAPDPDPAPKIAMTVYGITSPGARILRRTFEEAGYEVVSFHANGQGGALMEDLVRAGEFVAVVDLTLVEVITLVAEGMGAAREDRLSAAAESGVPTVLVPGAVDTVGLWPIPPGRIVHMHTPAAGIVRSNREENVAAAEWIADKARAFGGSLRIMIPSQGFSELSRPGGVFHDPETDAAFASTLAERAGDDVEIETVEANINDPDFAARVAAVVLASLDPDGDR
jgi:uncharacterized protein (UPF0261 family)